METQTLSIIAIGIGLIALMGCFVVGQMIPEEVENPLTMETITQYNDNIKVIQEDIIVLEGKTIPNYDIVLSKLRSDINKINIDDDDLEDLEDYASDFDDIDRNKDKIADIIECLKLTNSSDIDDCAKLI